MTPAAPTTPEETKRAQIIELCNAAAAARMSGDPLLIHWANRGIQESVKIIIPDAAPKPTLSDFAP